MRDETKRLTGPASPFELVETRIDGRPCRVFRHGPRTLPDVFRKAATAGRRPYLIIDRHEVSYEAVLRGAQALGRELVDRHGVRVGDHVGMILHNCPEWPMALIALTSIGAIATLLHRQRPAAELIEALDLCQCALVIADQPIARELRELGDRRPVLVMHKRGDTGTADNWFCCDTLETTAGTSPVARVDPEQEALVAFTSGSSSRAKGVILTHRAIVTGLMNMMLGGAIAATKTERRALPADAATRAAQPACFVAAPFSHASGYLNLLLMAYMAGKVVSQSSWNAVAALALMGQQGVRSLVGATPTMIREFLDTDPSAQDLRAFSSIGIHGSAAHPSLIGAIRASMPDVTVNTGYGMTETNGSVCAVSGSDLLEHPGTSGQPLPSVELRIERVEHGIGGVEIGEIWVRGAMLMRGYCGAPEATAEALCDGWFRTGDMGRVDAAGYLHVIDRRSNMIVCAERNFCAAEIERVLMKHPAVGEAVAVGVGEVASDQRLILCIVPNTARQLDAADLQRHTADLLQGTKAQIITLKSLPRTPSGKVDRSELRRRMADHTPAEVFTDHWYAGCRDGSVDAARLYTGYLWHLIQPRSVLDVGCGRGHWLSAWHERGSTVLIGLDGAWNHQQQMTNSAIRFIPVDLNRPFDLACRVELAMSLEVAEHLQRDSAETFIECLSRSSDLILFGAAAPHQGGPHHLNERPATYWATLLRRFGFQPYDILRPLFWDDSRVPFWYRQNTFLYAREDSVSSHKLAAQGLKPMEHIGFMDCVHPELYARKIGDIAALQARQAPTSK